MEGAKEGEHRSSWWTDREILNIVKKARWRALHQTVQFLKWDDEYLKVKCPPNNLSHVSPPDAEAPCSLTLHHVLFHFYSGTGSTIDKSNVNKLNISWLYRPCVTNKWRFMSTVCSGMHQCLSCSRQKQEKVYRKQENQLRCKNS